MTDLDKTKKIEESLEVKPPFSNGEHTIVKIAFIYNFSVLTRNCSFRISKHLYDWNAAEEGYVERIKAPIFGKPEVAKVYKSNGDFIGETYLTSQLPFFEIGKTFLSDNVSERAITEHINMILEKLRTRINDCYSTLTDLPSALPYPPNDEIILNELSKNYEMFMSLVSMAYDKMVQDEKSKLIEQE